MTNSTVVCNIFSQSPYLNQVSHSSCYSSTPAANLPSHGSLQGRGVAILRHGFHARCKACVPKGVAPARALAVDQSRFTKVGSNSQTVVDIEGRHTAGVLDFIAGLANGAKERILTAIVHSLFKPADDVNILFEGNFGPVPEIGGRVAARIIEGSIPADFPEGVYLRNGPNPQLGTYCTTSPFGNIYLHWFEGDGMVHATYFGPEGQVTYQNKFIETDGYKLERERNRRAWLYTAEGDSKAVAMACLFNQLRFGKVNKETCNTSVFQHGGKVFVVAEGDLPRELNPWDLSTGRAWNWHGQWNRPLTAHPKIVPDTKEMVVFGYAGSQPYYMTGVVSADGERIIHTCALELEKCKISHDIGITKRYNVILDWPLVVDPDRMQQGGNLITFDIDVVARVGIMPRFGDAKTIKWFNVEMNYTFHVINAYDDGDEVILHGCKARIPIFPSKPGMDKVEWFSRGITSTKLEDAKDPCVDGALFSHAHEWRFNLKEGTSVERDLTDDTFSLEMPKINEKFVGSRNKYAYANVLDIEQSKVVGMPKYGKLAKLHLNERDERNYIKSEFYDPGPHVYLSEPLFVPRTNGNEEDDGWIVTYTHNEQLDTSEVRIIDAIDLSKKALARIQLPQRVPYGFHSTFVQNSK